jgi:hypothetical protein
MTTAIRRTALPSAAMGAAMGAALLAASTTASHAGPCSHQIDQMVTRLNAALQAFAAKGPSARETVGAMTGRQPTPNSVAAAEEQLGDVSAEKIAAVKLAMERARAADSAGDGRACAQALADAQRELGP